MPSEIRAQQAREHHRLAGADEESARRHRESRDRLIRQLRAEDPERWTYAAIAAAVGITPELARAVVKGRVGGGSHPQPPR